MLQPCNLDAKEKSRHKFMVQSMIAVGNIEDLDGIVRAFCLFLVNEDSL